MGALTILVAAGAVAAVARNSRSTAVGGTEAPAKAGDRWLPHPMPARYFLMAAGLGGDGRPPAFIAASPDKTQVVSVSLFPGHTEDGGDYEDPVVVGDRPGTITGGNGATTIRFAWTDQEFVEFVAIGIDEAESIRLASSVSIPAARPVIRIEMATAPTWSIQRVDDTSLVSSTLVESDTLGLAAFVRVSTDRDASLTRLLPLTGALTERTVNGRSVLVGSRPTGHGYAQTGVVVEQAGRTVTVLGADDGTLTQDLIELALRTGPVNDAEWSAAKAAAGQVNTPCDPGVVAQAGAVSLPGGPHGPINLTATRGGHRKEPVVCVSDTAGGSFLTTHRFGEIQESGDGLSWQLMGAVAESTRLVRVEFQDGSTLETNTVPVADFPGRVWLLNLSDRPVYRAMEELDANGQVTVRHGRPRR